MTALVPSHYAGEWETRFTMRGTPYRVWKEPMPLIPPNILDCAIYLYKSESDANAGERSGGSGFLFGVHADLPGGTNLMHVYAVTNLHVIVRGAPVVRLNRINGDTEVIPFIESDWTPHPDGDDIAVCPLSLDWPNVRHHVVSGPIVAKGMTWNNRRISPGEDVYMVGRFISHDGRQKNTPIVRFGSIAMMPGDPIWNDALQIYQESYLVDTRAIGGFSGSAVFMYRHNYESPAYNTPPILHGIVGNNYGMLLGVEWGMMRSDWSPLLEKLPNGQSQEDPDKRGVFVNSGFSAVVPAWKLMELLDMPKFNAQREAIDAPLRQEIENQKNIGGAVPTDAIDPTPFDRLTDLARKVMQTPKSEVDKAEEEEKD